jgi:hypothetical protein
LLASNHRFLVIAVSWEKKETRFPAGSMKMNRTISTERATPAAAQAENPMALSLLERSNYYRGLLVLSGKDRIIDPRERQLMLEIGKLLDFERRFCEAAIDDLLVNTHIKKEPVLFSNPSIAECFFRDAVRLALIDGDLNPRELRWLRRVAQANGRTDRWLDTIIRDRREEIESRGQPVTLDIQQYL